MTNTTWRCWICDAKATREAIGGDPSHHDRQCAILVCEDHLYLAYDLLLRPTVTMTPRQRDRARTAA